jgi:hypothetical protein
MSRAYSIVICKSIVRQRPQHTHCQQYRSVLFVSVQLAQAQLRTQQCLEITCHVFSLGPARAPMNWLDSDHAMCLL